MSGIDIFQSYIFVVTIETLHVVILRQVWPVSVVLSCYFSSAFLSCKCVWGGGQGSVLNNFISWHASLPGGGAGKVWWNKFPESFIRTIMIKDVVLFYDCLAYLLLRWNSNFVLQTMPRSGLARSCNLIPGRWKHLSSQRGWNQTWTHLASYSAG